MSKAVVGQMVHFYSETLRFNGTSRGPFAAVVTELFPGSPYVNLRVIPPFADPFHEGSVTEGGETVTGRYWLPMPDADAPEA